MYIYIYIYLNEFNGVVSIPDRCNIAILSPPPSRPLKTPTKYNLYTTLSLYIYSSLSLYIYIYTCMHICVCIYIYIYIWKYHKTINQINPAQ